MNSTSKISDSVLSNPVYLESQSPQTHESHSQSNTLNSSSQQEVIGISSSKRKIVKFTSTMEQEFLKIVNDNKNSRGVNWKDVHSSFKKTYPTSEVSKNSLKLKYQHLFEEIKTAPTASVLPQQTTSSTSNTLNSSSQQQTIGTSSSKRKVFRITSTMEQELVKMVNDNKNSWGVSWEGVLSSFKKTYPTSEVSKNSLRLKYRHLPEEIKTAPTASVLPQQTTSSTSTSVNTQDDTQLTISSHLGSTSIEVTEKKRKYAVYTEDMKRKLVLLVNTTKTNGNLSWAKITELFNKQFPESHLSEQALQSKFRRLSEDEKSYLASEPTSTTLEQSEILDTDTTNSHNAESDVQPPIPHEIDSIQNVTSTNALCMNTNKTRYTEEMLVVLDEQAHVTLQADGTPDWDKISINFNERFPSVTWNKKNLAKRYHRLVNAKQKDQALGISSNASRCRKQTKFSREMEKELLHLGREQLDQNKEIDWQQIAKILNSKYMISRSENSYKSIFDILNNSELTDSDHSDSEVSDTE